MAKKAVATELIEEDAKQEADRAIARLARTGKFEPICEEAKYLEGIRTAVFFLKGKGGLYSYVEEQRQRVVAANSAAIYAKKEGN